MNNLKILTGDSLAILPTLAAESMQCCVTSPPYWGLRDYEHPAQIGAEPSPEIYVENIVAIFREVRRVLRKDGTVWLNVGDGYARNGGTGNHGPNAVVGNTKKLIQKRNCKVPDCWGLIRVHNLLFNCKSHTFRRAFNRFVSRLQIRRIQIRHLFLSNFFNLGA